MLRIHVLSVLSTTCWCFRVFERATVCRRMRDALDRALVHSERTRFLLWLATQGVVPRLMGDRLGTHGVSLRRCVVTVDSFPQYETADSTYCMSVLFH
jgi:hypothetical protein